MRKVAEPIAPGDVFSELTIIREIDPSPTNDRRFLCRCSCGNGKIAFVGNLRAGRTWSCGCVNRKDMAAARAAASNAEIVYSPDGRECACCKERKPWEEFWVSRAGANGHGSYCKTCEKFKKVCRIFGITPDEWHDLLRLQDGVCALCKEASHGASDGRPLGLDHDHSCCGSGSGCRQCIRGLLCGSCNLKLWHIEKDPDRREIFSFYLDRRPFLRRGSLCLME